MDAIQVSDVADVAKRHLVPDRMVVVAVGDRAKIEPQISKLKLGSIAYRDADGKEVASASSGSGSPATSN
jgi:zinc protease